MSIFFLLCSNIGAFLLIKNHFGTQNVILLVLMFVLSNGANADSYCRGMGVLAELAGKMRDRGFSERKTRLEIAKLSPNNSISKDVSDLVASVYMAKLSPADFRAMFENFCLKQGFEREIK